MTVETQLLLLWLCLGALTLAVALVICQAAKVYSLQNELNASLTKRVEWLEAREADR